MGLGDRMGSGDLRAQGCGGLRGAKQSDGNWERPSVQIWGSRTGLPCAYKNSAKAVIRVLQAGILTPRQDQSRIK